MVSLSSAAKIVIIRISHTQKMWLYVWNRKQKHNFTVILNAGEIAIGATILFPMQTIFFPEVSYHSTIKN